MIALIGLDGLIGGAFSLGGGIAANKAARKEARRNRQFQERMYRNRYQYTMTDLKSAGLNPQLGLSGGLSVGNAPAGSMAAQANPAAGVSQAFASATGARPKAKRDREETRRAAAERHRTRADEERIRALTDAQQQQALAEAEFKSEQAELSRAQQRGQSIRNTVEAAYIPSAKAAEELDKTWYGEGMIKLRRLLGIGNAIRPPMAPPRGAPGTQPYKRRRKR